MHLLGIAADLEDRMRARIGRRLEGAATPGRALRLAAEAWAAVAASRIARPISLPHGVRVIGIGGATLGGAGKTPLAIAVARALASSERVAIVGHAYRARPLRARRVEIDDTPEEVGDEALAAARALETSGVPVVVAPSRQAAIDHAAALGARVLVLDGVLQTTPRRVDRAVLVLDASRPWGARACPPAGDLRAAPAALLAAADHVALVGAPELPVADGIAVPVVLTGAGRADGSLVAPAELRRLRLGLLLAIAHPERVTCALEQLGIAPTVTHFLADHARLRRPPEAPGIDAWLTTPRCATKLPGTLRGAPVWPLVTELDVRALVARLERPM